MDYPFRKGSQPAGGHDQPKPKKRVGAARHYLAYSSPCWARVTPGDNVLPSFQYHSGGSSNILGNRPPEKQESC